MLFFYVKLDCISVTALEAAPRAIDSVGHFGELFFEEDTSGEAAEVAFLDRHFRCLSILGCRSVSHGRMPLNRETSQIPGGE